MMNRNALAGPEPLMPPSPSGPVLNSRPPQPRMSNQTAGMQPPNAPPTIMANDPLSLLEQAIAAARQGQLGPEDLSNVLLYVAQQINGMHEANEAPDES